MRGPYSTPITPLTGSLFHADPHVRGKSYSARFESVVAIERDEASHQTLLLRHFLRRFPYEQFPDDYYRYLRGDIDRDELYRNHKAEYQEAKESALKISLGPESHAEVKSLINRKLAGEKRWALVGGPPCQAYSLAGRARWKQTAGGIQIEAKDEIAKRIGRSPDRGDAVCLALISTPKIAPVRRAPRETAPASRMGV